MENGLVAFFFPSGLLGNLVDMIMLVSWQFPHVPVMDMLDVLKMTSVWLTLHNRPSPSSSIGLSGLFTDKYVADHWACAYEKFLVNDWLLLLIKLAKKLTIPFFLLGMGSWGQKSVKSKRENRLVTVLLQPISGLMLHLANVVNWVLLGAVVTVRLALFTRVSYTHE